MQRDQRSRAWHGNDDWEAVGRNFALPEELGQWDKIVTSIRGTLMEEGIKKYILSWKKKSVVNYNKLRPCSYTLRKWITHQWRRDILRCEGSCSPNLPVWQWLTSKLIKFWNLYFTKEVEYFWRYRKKFSKSWKHLEEIYLFQFFFKKFLDETTNVGRKWWKKNVKILHFSSGKFSLKNSWTRLLTHSYLLTCVSFLKSRKAKS